jgi:hypothetical protein
MAVKFLLIGIFELANPQAQLGPGSGFYRALGRANIAKHWKIDGPSYCQFFQL